MEYCIRGITTISSAYAPEIHMEMETWCEKNCKGRFEIVSHDEFRFSDKAEAKAFGTYWFGAGKWARRKLEAVCDVSGCKFNHATCPVACTDTEDD